MPSQMTRSSTATQGHSKKKLQLPEILEHHLTAYGLAAGAAALFASVQPAMANSILVQNINETLIGPGTLSFSLGSDTFTLVNARNLTECSGSVCRYISLMNMYGGFLVIPASAPFHQYPLNAGSYIGPRVPSSRLRPIGPASFLFSAQWSNHASHASHFGWAGLNFVGLRFDLHGQPHYGWLEILTAALTQNPPLESTFIAYGYNRQPNAGILAGQTSNHSVPEPASLALLAVGAAALPLWRRKQNREGGAR